jgi:hypothetical protein
MGFGLVCQSGRRLMTRCHLRTVFQVFLPGDQLRIEVVSWSPCSCRFSKSDWQKKSLRVNQPRGFLRRLNLLVGCHFFTHSHSQALAAATCCPCASNLRPIFPTQMNPGFSKASSVSPCKRVAARPPSRDMPGRNRGQVLSKDICSNLQETGAVAHQELFAHFNG